VKKLLVGLGLALALLVANTNPVSATATNTTHRTTHTGCILDAAFGNFGSTPYATARIFDNTNGISCRVREIVVVWTSPIGETVGGAHPPWNHASWQQLNGPNGKTAFGAVICVEFVGPYGFHFWSTWTGSVYDGKTHGEWMDYGDVDCRFG
jgi:hypothetical protein